MGHLRLLSAMAPKPSLKRGANSAARGPRDALVHRALHGPGTVPPSPAWLQCQASQYPGRRAFAARGKILRMTPTARRVVQAVLYEAIAIAFVGPAMSLMFEQSVGSTFALAVLMSTIALGWNYAFNGVFEAWESRQVAKGRSFKRRLAHCAGFEGGLVLMLVPVMAYWLETTLLHAFLADLGIVAFFFVYAVVFTWAFDRVFGLPQSATKAYEA